MKNGLEHVRCTHHTINSHGVTTSPALSVGIKICQRRVEATLRDDGGKAGSDRVRAHAVSTFCRQRNGPESECRRPWHIFHLAKYIQIHTKSFDDGAYGVDDVDDA